MSMWGHAGTPPRRALLAAPCNSTAWWAIPYLALQGKGGTPAARSSSRSGAMEVASGEGNTPQGSVVEHSALQEITPPAAAAAAADAATLTQPSRFVFRGHLRPSFPLAHTVSPLSLPLLLPSAGAVVDGPSVYARRVSLSSAAVPLYLQLHSMTPGWLRGWPPAPHRDLFMLC